MENSATQISIVKKFILAMFGICALAQTIQAQNLTVANVAPVTGDSLFYRYANYASVSPSGVNQLFNYSMLTIDTTGYTKKYMTPIPYQYMLQPLIYTLATTALPKYLIPHCYYFRADSTGLYEVAAIGSVNQPYKDLFIKFPVVLNKKDSLILSYSDPTIGTTSPAWISGSVSIIADASGTLITPSGTYNNTFRFHQLKYDEYVTSFYGGKKITIKDSYYWYTPGIHGALLSIYSLTVIGTNSLGTVTSSSSQKWSEVYSNPNNPLGVTKNTCNTLTNFSFQNPVSNQLILTIESPETYQSELEIADLTGKILIIEKSNNNHYDVETSSLAKGIYVVQLSTHTGLKGRKKLIINR
jgi:hypothetical protein